MQVSFQAFWMPKAGNSPEEYEDAFAPEGSAGAQECTVFRCAVADGATETSFSGLWAQLLVQEYCRQTGRRSFLRALPSLRSLWQDDVRARPLPWYAEEKARSGAFSSLLGLTIKPGYPSGKSPLRWEAMAVGDSCLFHVRGEQMIRVFPVSCSDEFGYHPYLLATNAESDTRLSEHLYLLHGSCFEGDAFYLMTDALAHWFLREIEKENYDLLSDITTQAVFEQLVREQRASRDDEGKPLMRNDDVTFVRVLVTR